ncbi:MAG: hypothetical protein HYY05_07960 [Chloroflexi bacterium]|nr:hypothetical protein [Chloroflexota bacterium]
MNSTATSRGWPSGRLAWRLGSAGLLGLLVACTAQPAPQPAAREEAAAPPPAPQGAAPAAAPAATPLPQKLLKIEPVKGYIGDRFTVAGEGLPSNASVDVLWSTVDAAWDMKPTAETVQYYDRTFTPSRISLGRATTDAEGRVNASLTVPDDYGELHDIFVVLDGQDVARGGYRILPQITMAPTQGPVGTPIRIEARGFGWKPWESTKAISYDNKYTGFLSAVTTRGSASAVIRAVGPVGKHTIDVGAAGQMVPYINWEQSPQAHIPKFHFEFTVTADPGPPPATLEWPQGGPGIVAVNGDAPKTTASGIENVALVSAGKVSAAITPAAGPILSKASLKVANLPPGMTVDFLWMTARGSRTSGSGWFLAEIPMGRAMTGPDGSLTHAFDIPDDLGGWHTVKIVAGGQVLAEVPYLVQPSLVGVTPGRVKAGETFSVQIKGVGWTELDNTYTVVYDNAYVGFACGFNSNGDVTVNLRAAGGPGTHLIDLYPTIYKGQGKPPWLYDMPMLTALQDHPSLSLGYRLPIFRLAIEVVE